MTRPKERIFLSPPWTGAEERKAVERAFDTGYVAPCGPMVDEFESALAKLSGRRFAVAVSSGTDAIDLVMEHLGVDSSWTVVAPTLTFIATVGPAWHRGAKIVFIDSDSTGNIDLELLDGTLSRLSPGRMLVLTVDLYGRCVDYASAAEICARRGAVFVSDSAEAVGAASGASAAGSAGLAAVYSFNGNKIVTTSGGGAVVTDSKRLADHVRKLSRQSRENRVWYEHREVGYNRRMSNILAAIGLAQLAKLPAILRRRAEIAEFYRSFLDTLVPVPGENHWLAVALMKSRRERDEALARLAAENIEARPVWKPMHLQPVFRGEDVSGGKVAEDFFARGLCLPSGTGMTVSALERVKSVLQKGGRRP